MLYEKLLGAVPEGTPADPYFKNVSMLLPGDVNQSLTYTAFSDASTNNFSITPNGDTYGTPFSPYNTSWSNYFDGSGDYLSATNNAAFSLASAAFTVEAWVYFNNPAAGQQSIVTTYGSGTSGWSLQLNGSATISWYASGDGADITGTTSIKLGQWYHIAVSGTAGTSTKLFVNGVQEGSTYSGNIVDSSASLVVGQIASSNNINGYISNLRIVKGAAVYTGNFTPPSLANLATSGSASAACYSSTTNVNTSFAASATSLLTCQSNRFIDNSSNSFAITVNGNTSISSNSPIADTDTTTGSGYFDGSGDFLKTTFSSALTSTYTVECWINTNTIAAGDGAIINIHTTSTNTQGFTLKRDGSQIAVNNGVSVGTGPSGGTLTVGTWFHIAVVCDGSNTKLYINGSLISTYAGVSLSGLPTVVNIGTFGDAAGGFNGYISNLRVVKGTAVYTGNFTPPTASLATSGAASAASYPSTTNVNTSFASSDTSLLTLQTRGAVQNIGFIDSSPNKFPITKVGNTTQGTFSPYGNLWSNYFDGSGDYLSCSGTAIGTGNVTTELWFFATDSSSTYRCLFDGRSATGTNTGLGIFQYGSTIEIYGNGFQGGSAANAFGANTWVHCAVVRNSGSCQIYINGTASGSSFASSSNFTSTVRKIGSNAATGEPFVGYISNVREVTSAIYTFNFTPSTTPLTAVSGTSLLTCQSNRFIDSSNNFTLTVNGNTSVQRFSPFNPTAAYSAATIGGSGYFDGAGDYLTVPDNAALRPPNGDFTYEIWWYPTSLSPTYQEIFTKGAGVQIYAASTLIKCALSSSNSGTYYIDASFGTLNLNSWNHIAVVRTGTTYYGYLNGTRTALGTSASYPETGTDNVVIGAYAAGQYPTFGYLSNARYTTSAVYTTNPATVPTAPLTAITNTSLLCNFTNAGVWDAAMLNDLESVGNARIVTTVKKYNTGSMYFDGTGDYLYGNSNQLFNLSTGDWTIEAWVYPTALNSYSFVCNLYAAAGSPSGLVFGLNSTGKIYIGNGVVIGTSGNTNVSLNTWTHIAAVKNGSNVTFYLNGSSDVTPFAFTPNAGGFIRIGANANAGDTFTGYIDDLRITKGYARYPTEPFPTAALPLY